MPQDSLRSAVYRSFVTCDDPKGVVECRTIRKSKSNARRLEDNVQSRRIPKNLNSSSAYKKEGKEMASKNVAEELQNPSSCQLMEVSRGAQKLNQVIDSWSNGMTFDGDSKEIAEDLLKGALDLQESLIMLGKLQEASQYMAKLKKKQKVKSRGERIDELGIKSSNSHHSHHSTDHNFEMGFQKPRLSADGSSRDCFEELRTAIRDGLARQNLLPPSEEKAYCDKRMLHSALDMASTSSSQSSMVNFHSFASSDSSQSSMELSSKARQKSKGSNLIAKLMGLEEIPAQAVQNTLQKELESEKISSPRRPMFDIDMPKARKPCSAACKVDTEHVKLKEIVEAMQFKGLLKGNSAEGFGLQYHHSNASNSRKRFIEDAPPIVIIKPLHFSSGEAEEPHLQKLFRDVGALDANEVLRKLKTKELQPQTRYHSEGALNSNEMWRRLKGEETPIKRHSQEGDKIFKEVQAKPEVVVVKTNEKPSSNKLKASVPVNQQQKKKAIEKKVDRIQKATPHRKKPAEMENVKSKAVSKSHDQAKVTSTKERKPEIGSTITKSRISQQNSAFSRTPAISRSSGDRKNNLRKEKQVKEPVAANLVVENAGCKYDDKLIDPSCENEADMTRGSTNPTDQLLAKEGKDFSEIRIKDQCDRNQNSLCNVTQQNTQHKSYINSAEEAKYCISQNSAEKKGFRTKPNAKDLVLSSPPFLSYAEELFDINANEAIVLQTTSLNDSGIADTRLLLDCANELMHHKSLRCAQAIHPLLPTPVKSSNISISLAQLVEEVCNGIENLRSYSKHAGEKLPTDSLSAVLQRDLRCKGVESGAWDLGWRHGFTVSEVEQVVGDIEKLVFRGLIEDMFKDFVL